MIIQTNGCKSGLPSVYPQNWKTTKADLKLKWCIRYRFYDPQNGSKLIVIKGMNLFRTLKERQQITSELLAQELDLLQNRGYNPITDVYKTPENETGFDITRDTRFIDALWAAYKTVDYVPDALADMRSVIKGTEGAAVSLGFQMLPISTISRKHIVKILEMCRKINPAFSNSRHNRYKAYLSKLFKYIRKVEAIENNPCSEIEHEQVDVKKRQVLTRHERIQINTELHEKHYNFWRFMQIFFHSGGRETEMNRLQACHVDLERQRYKTLIKKRKKPTWVWKTIKTVALPYWKEVLAEVKDPNHFLFSVGLVPGDNQTRTEQIGRRWKRIVKGGIRKTGKNKGQPYGMGIDKDFYSLKYSNTSEIVSILGDQDAAKMNAHTSTAMVVKIYDTDREDREHQRLKDVDNSFS